MNASRQQIAEIAGEIYPAAAVALYCNTHAQQAVAEAVTAALRKVSPAALRTEALRRTMQICNARSGETPQEEIFPADSPLAAAAKLPFRSRSDLALLAACIPDEDAAQIMHTSQSELDGRYQKALRQMSFLLDGKAPSIPECQQAAAALRTPEIISAITDKIMQAEQQRVKEEQEKSLHAEKEKKPESAKIHQIVRNVPREERAGGVTVPVWAMVTAVVCILLLGGALGYLAFRQPADRPPEASAEESLPQSVVQRFEELQYIGMAAAQQKAAEAAGLDAASAVFFSTKLSADGNAVRYEAELAGHDGTAYICTVDAVSGEVLSVRSEPAEYVPDPAGWLPLETLRSMALECAALEKAVFTKEKLSTESDIYYYKFEFTDSAGRSFNVHENAETGALLKYTVKEPPPANEEALISLEKAREQALSRAAASADQVIFTKEKLEGAVWMMAMTLNDGTQYTVELDARTGMANTVDVHPVSADTSQMMGMLAAKDFALKKAGLKDDGSVRFTKAKIDRSGGAYVYELAFENAEYEYEITLRAKNGEILKFRTSAL